MSYKTIVYENDDFVLLKIEEICETQSVPSYLPVGQVSKTHLCGDISMFEYYTRQWKIKG